MVHFYTLKNKNFTSSIPIEKFTRSFGGVLAPISKIFFKGTILHHTN